MVYVPGIQKRIRFFRRIFILVTAIYIGLSCYSQPAVDADGNNYPVIQAGHYLWMAENLRVTHDPQGNDLSYFKIENPYMDTCHYGFLYSWLTAMDSAEMPGTRGICPEGWHIPTDAEWDTLTEWAGGINLAGVMLKRQGTGNFGVLMAGNYNPVQKMDFYFGDEAYFWTSDSYSASAAWMRHLGFKIKNINRSTVPKHYSFSIRCVRVMN